MKLIKYIVFYICLASCLLFLPTTIATASATKASTSIVAFSASCLLSLPTAMASTKATKAKAAPNKIKESSNKIVHSEYMLGLVSCPKHCASGANYGGILFANNVEECDPEDKDQRWITHQVDRDGEVYKFQSRTNLGRCLGVADHGGDMLQGFNAVPTSGYSPYPGVNFRYVSAPTTIELESLDYIRIVSEAFEGDTTPTLVAAIILGPRKRRVLMDSIISAASVIAAGLAIGLAAIGPGIAQQKLTGVPDAWDWRNVDGTNFLTSMPSMKEDNFNGQLAIALVDCQDPTANWLLTGAQLFSAALWSEGHSAAMAVNEDCTSLELSLAANGDPKPITRAESLMFLEPSFIESIVPAEESTDNGGAVSSVGGASAGSWNFKGVSSGGASGGALNAVLLSSESKSGPQAQGPEEVPSNQDLSMKIDLVNFSWSHKTARTTVDIPFTDGIRVGDGEYNNLSLVVWDVYGQDMNRPIWRNYSQNTQGVIFVVDFTDSVSIDMAKTEMNQLLRMEVTVPFIIVALEQDLSASIGLLAIKEELGLSNAPVSWRWQIAKDLSYETLVWISEEIAPPVTALPSDIRLKHNIEHIGKSPTGIPIYSFQYRDGIKLADNLVLDTKSTFVGVMAQDLLELAPHAVTKNEDDGDGFYRVDYSKIDVEFGKL